MRDLPFMARLFINILLFCIYVLISSVIFSFLFPLVLQILGKEVLDPTDPVFIKIQIFIIFFVFLVSIIFRKYFYVLANAKEHVETYTFENPEHRYTKSKKKVKKETRVEADDDEIKIYVEKEIK